MFPFDDTQQGSERGMPCVWSYAVAEGGDSCESWWCDLPGPNDTPTLFERPLCKGEGEVPPCVRRR